MASPFSYLSPVGIALSGALQGYNGAKQADIARQQAAAANAEKERMARLQYQRVIDAANIRVTGQKDISGGYIDPVTNRYVPGTSQIKQQNADNGTGRLFGGVDAFGNPVQGSLATGQLRADTADTRVQQQGDALYGYDGPNGHVMGTAEDKQVQIGVAAWNLLGKNAPFFQANPAAYSQYGSLIGAVTSKPLPTDVPLNLSAPDAAAVKLRAAQAGKAAADTRLTGIKADDQQKLDHSIIGLRGTQSEYLGSNVAKNKAIIPTIAPLASSLIGLRGAQGAAATSNAATAAGRLGVAQDTYNNGTFAQRNPTVAGAKVNGQPLLPNGLTQAQDIALSKQETDAHAKLQAATFAYNNTRNLDKNSKAELNRLIIGLNQTLHQIHQTRNAKPIAPAPSPSFANVPGVGRVAVPSVPTLPNFGGFTVYRDRAGRPTATGPAPHHSALQPRTQGGHFNGPPKVPVKNGRRDWSKATTQQLIRGF